MTNAMPVTCHARWQRRIERAFVGRLSVRGQRHLRVHLGQCDGCRAVFDRLGHASRALAPHAPLPADAMDRIGAHLMPPPGGRARLIGTLSLAAAAVAALVFFVLPRGERKRTDEFRARGGTGADAATERQAGALLVCIAPPNTVRASAQLVAAPLPPATVRCKLSDDLQLAYSTPGQGGLYMVAYGKDEAGELFWYAPHHPEEPAMTLAADQIDAPLPTSTRLAVRHHPGTYQVVVRFVDRPLPTSEVPALPAPQAELRLTLVIEP